MKLIKLLFLGFLFFLIFYWWQNRRRGQQPAFFQQNFFKKPALKQILSPENKKASIPFNDKKFFLDQNEILSFIDKAKQVGSASQQILGANTRETINGNGLEELPQKTLEYAKYLYCRQVVQDYEKQKQN